MRADNIPGTGKGTLLPGAGTIGLAGQTLLLRFPGRRTVLSTSWLNGGLRADLVAVFNHRIPVAACEACHSGGSIREYLAGVAGDLGLDPGAACGLVTRADMRNVSITAATFRDLRVTAIVTAGIDKNGGRAGDPATYYEENGSFSPAGGTINTILVIGADLPAYAMTRAVITATEAKAAALQQLMARSLYSTGIATGSGTDMIAVVCDPGSPLKLTDAGLHAKLGELIGTTVMQATTEALEKETGLCARSQRDVLVRLSRFGITVADLLDAAEHSGYLDTLDIRAREGFPAFFQDWTGGPVVVAQAAAALHVADEAAWGLIPSGAAREAVARILGDGDGMAPDKDLPHAVAAMLARTAARDYARSVAHPHGSGEPGLPDHGGRM